MRVDELDAQAMYGGNLKYVLQMYKKADTAIQTPMIYYN